MTRSTMSAGQQRDDQGYDVVDAEQHHRAGHTRKVGLQYGRIHVRLPACRLRFGSTYIRSVPSDCLLVLGLCLGYAAIRCRNDSRPSCFERPVTGSLRRPKPLFGFANAVYSMRTVFQCNTSYLGVSQS